MTDITEITRRALENRQPTIITKQIATALMREKAAQIRGETGLTYAQDLVDAAWEGAILGARKGDASMFNALMDRIEGKVPQAVAMDLNATVRGIVSAEPPSEEEWERLYGHNDRPRIGNGNGSHLASAAGTTKGSN